MAKVDETLAKIFLGMGGQTLYTLGTAFVSVGVLYAINRITKRGIDTLDYLPYLIGSKTLDPKDEKVNTVVFTKHDIVQGVTSYMKIAGVIVLGVAIKYLGNRMAMDSTIHALNEIIYGKLIKS